MKRAARDARASPKHEGESLYAKRADAMEARGRSQGTAPRETEVTVRSKGGKEGGSTRQQTAGRISWPTNGCDSRKSNDPKSVFSSGHFSNRIGAQPKGQLNSFEQQNSLFCF